MHPLKEIFEILFQIFLQSDEGNSKKILGKEEIFGTPTKWLSSWIRQLWYTREIIKGKEWKNIIVDRYYGKQYIEISAPVSSYIEQNCG